MSYLHTPRIHVFGQFFTDPSSMNNDPVHYDPDCTRPAPWQEPNGLHHFKLVECSVTSALDASGRDAGSDPVLSATVKSDDIIPGAPNPSPAKLVDLDVYQQGTSEIFGLRIQIVAPSGDAMLWGTMDPPVLNGVWFTAVLPTRGWNTQYGWGSYGGDYDACGMFQSILRVPEARWPTGLSRVLDQLREACAVVTDVAGNRSRLVSFKFVLDGFNNVQGNSNYRLGRFTGTLGPQHAGDPTSAPAGYRWLNARPLPKDAAWYVPNFYGAPFIVDQSRKSLVFDLANSICRQLPGGDPVDLGTISVVIPSPDPTRDPTVLGTIVFNQFTYSNSAGITELPLTDAQLALVMKNPITLMTSREDIGAQAFLSEDPSGLACAVDQRSLRMTSEPGSSAETAAVQVYFTKFGAPAAGVQWGVLTQPVRGNTPNATVPPTNPGDNFNADGVLATSLSPSDARGFATLKLRVLKDPGSRTSQLDGQLYFVYPLPDPGRPSYAQETLLSVLVWSQYPVDEDPDWSEIRRLMVPYAKLYPGMTDKINLTDLHTFTIFSLNPPWAPTYNVPPDYNVMGIKAGAIPFFLTRDMNDPRLMPLTRDLSPNKVKTILYFVKKLQKGPPPAR